MKKKLKVILCLTCLIALCLGVCACTGDSPVDEYKNKGYVISVSYDANGGKYYDRENISLTDMINPSSYEADENGVRHIKLLSPNDPRRPVSEGSESIYITKTSSFLVGWYRERIPATNENGKVVDENGTELEERNGSYVYPESGSAATPMYTYSGLWDFENDTLDYSDGDGVVSMTLYAGWMPYFEFNYYFKIDDEWVLSDSVSRFDYITTTAEGSTTFDRNTIWLPDWVDGAMNYGYSYNDGTPYNFPRLNKGSTLSNGTVLTRGKTFVKAYLDADCTIEITDKKFVHTGTLDYETATAENRVQNIYIIVEDGVQYKIENAEQLSKNADTDGIYEIYGDLDFTDTTWPLGFMTGSFTGKMFGEGGKEIHIKNINARYNSSSSLLGGLFGEIAEGGEITGIKFDDVTFDLANTGRRLRDTQFGMLSGFIHDKAKVENVSIFGNFRIGPINLDADSYNINLVANGNTNNVVVGEIKLFVYGEDLFSTFNYTVDPENVQVDEEKNVTLAFTSSKRLEQAEYEIKY